MTKYDSDTMLKLILVFSKLRKKVLGVLNILVTDAKSCESNAIIDKFVLDGCLIDSVDSLQVCGLEIHFGDTTLAEPGLYVGTLFYTFTIDKSLSNIRKYFDLARHLLCFRDQCVTISNQYEDHLINSRSKKISTKRTIHDLPKDDLNMKQNFICGSWNPPHTSTKRLIWYCRITIYLIIFKELFFFIIKNKVIAYVSN
jgi:hypothetical protein